MSRSTTHTLTHDSDDALGYLEQGRKKVSLGCASPELGLSEVVNAHGNSDSTS